MKLIIEIDAYQPTRIVEILRGSTKVDVVIRDDIRQTEGHYLITNRDKKCLAFHRETHTDFMKTIYSKRLRAMIFHLLQNCDYPVVIIECDNNWDIDQDLLEKTVRTINFRLTVIGSCNLEDTAGIILNYGQRFVDDELFLVKRPVKICPT